MTDTNTGFTLDWKHVLPTVIILLCLIMIFKNYIEMGWL